ncbi:uncharacterized protein LOC117178856 [Belonocnema kinseyi]|uniref:uncharacterized protein LOC117178856 n=1 Tax=Belonocnema kinseyi TaxID=2817044 RepID=UPI00143D39E2|nr:uncharacterized protein LOC117178856 [Belonocnema kinseyi]
MKLMIKTLLAFVVFYHPKLCSTNPSGFSHFLSNVGNTLNKQVQGVPKILQDSAPYVAQMPYVGQAMQIGQVVGSDASQAAGKKPLRPIPGFPPPATAAGGYQGGYRKGKISQGNVSRRNKKRRKRKRSKNYNKNRRKRRNRKKKQNQQPKKSQDSEENSKQQEHSENGEQLGKKQEE